MTTHISVNFDHPINRDATDFLTGSWKKSSKPKSAAPEEIEDPKESLGTHPEMLVWLWSTMTDKLPVDCRWVVYGTPVLVHPTTGIIFGMCYGQSLCALRLTLDDARMAPMEDGMETECTLEDGTTLYSDEIGHEWVFCSWEEELDIKWCLRAYKAAEKVSAY